MPLLGARTLLGAPGLTTRNKKLLGAPGIATRSKRFEPGSESEEAEENFDSHRPLWWCSDHGSPPRARVFGIPGYDIPHLHKIQLD